MSFLHLRGVGVIVDVLVDNGESALRSEVDGVAFLLDATVGVGALAAEDGLEIAHTARLGSTCKHEHGSPLGHGDTHSESATGESDGLVVAGNGLLHTLEGVAVASGLLVEVVTLVVGVACNIHYGVLGEWIVLPVLGKQSGEAVGSLNARHIPQCMVERTVELLVGVGIELV